MREEDADGGDKAAASLPDTSHAFRILESTVGSVVHIGAWWRMFRTAFGFADGDEKRKREGGGNALQKKAPKRARGIDAQNLLDTYIVDDSDGDDDGQGGGAAAAVKQPRAAEIVSDDDGGAASVPIEESDEDMTGGGGARAAKTTRGKKDVGDEAVTALDPAERVLLRRFWRAIGTLRAHGFVRPYRRSTDYVEKCYFSLVEYPRVPTEINTVK